MGAFTGWFGLLDFGLSGAVSRYVTLHFAQGDYESCNAYANSSFFLYLRLGVFAFLLALAAAAISPLLVADVQDRWVVPVLLVLNGFAFALDLPLRALGGLINGCMRQDWSALLQLASRVLNALVTTVILWLGGRLIALSLVNLSLLVLFAFAWYRAAQRTLPVFRLDRRFSERGKRRSLLKYGGIAFIGRIAETVLFRLDSFIIAALIAVAAVTHFNIASTLAAYFQIIMTAVTSGLVNWFAHKIHRDEKGVEESLLVSTRFCVLIGGFGLFGLIAWGQPFIQRWMGSPYLDAYPCLVALSIGMFFRGCQQSNLNLLYALAKHHIFAFANVLEGVLTVALALLFARRYGLVGIAAGTALASAIVNGIAFPLACCRSGGIPVLKYYGTILWGLAVVAVAVVLPAWLTRRFVTPDYVTLILVGAASTLVYFPVVLVLGSTASERSRIIQACFNRRTFFAARPVVAAARDTAGAMSRQCPAAEPTDLP